MAKLYITEYVSQPFDTNGQRIPAGQEPGVTTQVVTFTTTTQSAAFNAKTKFVRVHTDAICSVEFGENPTATTSSARMVAGSTEFFGVVPGHKVAAVTDT